MKKLGFLASLFFMILCTPADSGKPGNSSNVSDPAASSRTGHLINYSKSLPSLLDSLDIAKEDLLLKIDKSDYTLTIATDSLIIKEYPCVFGGNPIDDKRKEGDQCTPEGEFHMITKYPHKSWSKFIWIDYPTTDSWRKHKAAKANGNIPGSASIGGEIGIHGVPEGMDELIDRKYNWTLGCISLKNKDVNEIYPYMTKSIPILITP
ncbi:MAG: L,D-transpeptidase [Bacteroidales bacterium]|nr:L,D-transpeptidase [Bacteroidales bacterium]